MKIEYQDSIDRFLLNRMSEEERKSFETKCTENAELKEQLEHTRKVRTVISARGRIMEMVQKWDDEYDKAEKESQEESRKSAREKRLFVYWLSGIAAVFIVGYFLFSGRISSDVEKTGNLVSVKQERESISHVDSTIGDSQRKGADEKLIAKTETTKDKREANETSLEERDKMNPLNQQQVHSFGENSIFKVDPSDKKEYEKELAKVNAELQDIIEKEKLSDKQFASGIINQESYNTSMKLLKEQKDQLNWKKATVLIGLNRVAEAMDLLNELRRNHGYFQKRADSLYHELNN